MHVYEGRLVERLCPHCGNLERRAFGEFESSRGELASYAFGWTSGHEDVLAHMTIGIGAGAPGGGTFHMQVRLADSEPGMGLVDEPFEDVPEGGPHLTRAQAIAHADLPFVWVVADTVMADDRRAWWMEHWLRGTPALATPPVVDRVEPVRHVTLDEDGEWRLLCGTTDSDEDQPYTLFLALDDDPTLLEVLDLEPGERAERDGPGRRWKRARAA